MTDVDTSKKALAAELGARWVEPGDAHTVEADLFVPCGLGRRLSTDRVIDELRVRGVVGAANNQLASRDGARRLADRGILWAPDFVANGGGVIYLDGASAGDADLDAIDLRVQAIGDTVSAIFREAAAARHDDAGGGGAHRGGTTPRGLSGPRGVAGSVAVMTFSSAATRPPVPAVDLGRRITAGVLSALVVVVVALAVTSLAFFIGGQQATAALTGAANFFLVPTIVAGVLLAIFNSLGATRWWLPALAGGLGAGLIGAVLGSILTVAGGGTAIDARRRSGRSSRASSASTCSSCSP